MSGSAPIHDAVFRQTGVIKMDRMDEMLDVASALIRQPLPRSMTGETGRQASGQPKDEKLKENNKPIAFRIKSANIF
jgi:hypothetical protein